MSVEDYPPIEFIRQCFHEEGGRLFWLRRPREHFSSDRTYKTWNTRFAGTEAGCFYVTSRETIPRCIVGLGKLMIPRPSLVWVIHNDEWRHGLDHKNQIPSDDRIENLRVASPSQNAVNSKVRSDNRSGFRGVSWNKRKAMWVAKICLNGRRIDLGYFDDLEQAAAAYADAARKFFGDFVPA